MRKCYYIISDLTGVPDLFARMRRDWVEDPQIDESGETTTVTGEADVAVVLADLAALSAGFGAPADLPAPDEDALDEIVESSAVRAVLHGDEHELRSLDVTIELGTGESGGGVEPVTIRFTMELEPLADDLVVEPPQ